MLDYKMFLMQMNTIAVILKQQVSEDILKSEYYHIFKGFPNRRFGAIIAHFKENYSYNRFPLPGDFKNSIYATAKPAQSDNSKIEKKVFYSFKFIIDGLKLLDVIEKEVLGKQRYGQFSKTSRMKIFKPFIRDKMKKQEVYNTVTKKWGHVSKKSFEDGVYFDPRDLYPQKEY